MFEPSCQRSQGAGEPLVRLEVFRDHVDVTGDERLSSQAADLWHEALNIGMAVVGLVITVTLVSGQPSRAGRAEAGRGRDVRVEGG